MMEASFQMRLRGLALCSLAILAAAAALAFLVNALRPAESRLPLVGEWANYIETRAREAGIEPITMPVVWELLEQTPPAILLDARPFALYDAGHLPGALSLPMDDFLERFVELAPELPMDAALLLYCDGLDCGDSLSLGLELKASGYTNLFLYPGGFAEWAKFDGRIETAEAP